MINKIPKEVLSPDRKIIISTKINKIGLRYLIFLKYFLDKNKIQKSAKGNNLDKKLPTTISSPKKLDNLFATGDLSPITLKPKKNWK